MQEVNVYVKTTAHGPARKKRAYYAYVIQMLMPHKEYIRKGFGAMENVTENQITLTALVKAFERATSRKVPYKIVERRPGDIATCYADPTKAYEELGWRAEKTLEDMCQDAWRYIEKQTEK